MLLMQNPWYKMCDSKDDDSIRENGRIKYTFPKNPLVQTREQAQKIADNLLAYFKDPMDLSRVER